MGASSRDFLKMREEQENPMEGYFVDEAGKHYKRIGEKFFTISIEPIEVSGKGLKPWIYKPPTDFKHQDKSSKASREMDQFNRRRDGYY